jgi:hypothetical protein
MPGGERAKRDGYARLVRRINVIRGIVKDRIECRSTFNYARDAPETVINFRRRSVSLARLDPGSHRLDPSSAMRTESTPEVTLAGRQTTRFVLRTIAGRVGLQLGSRRLVRKWRRMAPFCVASRWPMVAGYSAPPDRRLERLAAYSISDRFAVESLIGLPWNR